MTTSYIREAQKELKAQKALAREAEALALSEANAKAAKEEAENNERIARKLARIAGNPVPEPEPQPEPEAGSPAILASFLAILSLFSASSFAAFAFASERANASASRAKAFCALSSFCASRM